MNLKIIFKGCPEITELDAQSYHVEGPLLCVDTNRCRRLYPVQDIFEVIIEDTALNLPEDYKEALSKLHTEYDFGFWRDFSTLGFSGAYCRIYVAHDKDTDEVTLCLDEPSDDVLVSRYYLDSACAALVKESDLTVVGFVIQLPKQK